MPPLIGPIKHRARPARVQAVTRRLELIPLSWRVVAILVTLVLATLTLTSLVAASLLQRDLLGRMDADLRVAAQAVSTGQAGNFNAPTLVPSSYALLVMPSNSDVVKVWLPASQPPTTRPDLPVLRKDDPRVQSHIPFTVSSVGAGPSWRMIAGHLKSGDATFAIGTPLTSVIATQQRLLALTVVLGTAATASAAVLGWVLMRRAFRPLRRIEDTAAAIAAGDLSRRIPERHSRDEVESLSRSLNTMLSQVEQAFVAQEASEARMRQFIADASHELRTPLVTVRGYAELYRQGAISNPAEVSRSMGRIESEARRMSGLVEDLLLLARMDEQRPFDLIPVDLVVLAVESAKDARIRQPQRSISVQALDGELRPTYVLGDPARLHQLLVNLLTNALVHTPSDTTIEVAVGTSGPMAYLQVRDHGEGLDAAARDRVFERFYRADKARSRQRGGSGLGLAIVAAITHHHGGRVGVAETPGGGATFAIAIPAVDNPDGDQIESA